MNKELEEKIEELYASGELTLDEARKIKNKFSLVCKFCKSEEVSIATQTYMDGCESCSSPYAKVTIKCKKCGQGVSIRGY